MFFTSDKYDNYHIYICVQAWWLQNQTKKKIQKHNFTQASGDRYEFHENIRNSKVCANQTIFIYLFIYFF